MFNKLNQFKDAKKIDLKQQAYLRKIKELSEKILDMLIEEDCDEEDAISIFNNIQAMLNQENAKRKIADIKSEINKTKINS